MNCVSGERRTGASGVECGGDEARPRPNALGVARLLVLNALALGLQVRYVVHGQLLGRLTVLDHQHARVAAVGAHHLDGICVCVQRPASARGRYVCSPVLMVALGRYGVRRGSKRVFARRGFSTSSSKVCPGHGGMHEQHLSAHDERDRTKVHTRVGAARGMRGRRRTGREGDSGSRQERGRTALLVRDHHGASGAALGTTHTTLTHAHETWCPVGAVQLNSHIAATRE
jgi:hypothetical protein